MNETFGQFREVKCLSVCVFVSVMCTMVRTRKEFSNLLVADDTGVGAELVCHGGALPPLDAGGGATMDGGGPLPMLFCGLGRPPMFSKLGGLFWF